jgi:hypothetical protein
MLPPPTVPASLLAVLEVLRPCFTAPTYLTFCHLALGMATGTGRRTVTGMLTASGLARTWSHDRAHQFFSRAGWDPDRLGLVLAKAVVALLVPPGSRVLVVVDDTLFRRFGRKIHAALWAHDGSGRGKDKTGFGNTWVIVAIVVRLPFLTRPVALPVLAALWRGKGTASRTQLALGLVTGLAAVLPGHRLDVVADAVYHHGDIVTLPVSVTWTVRLARNAVLTGPTPPRTGKRGRPRKKGNLLGTPAQVADAITEWVSAQVTRYGESEDVLVAAVSCQWYGAFKGLPVRLVLLREKGTTCGYDLALLTTDLHAGPAELVTRYGCRWSIEVIFQHGRSDLGIGQAHNRTARAVERSVPFGLAVYAITVLWYARYGYHPGDVTQRRRQAPW